MQILETHSRTAARRAVLPLPAPLNPPPTPPRPASSQKTLRILSLRNTTVKIQSFSVFNCSDLIRRLYVWVSGVALANAAPPQGPLLCNLAIKGVSVTQHYSISREGPNIQKIYTVTLSGRAKLRGATLRVQAQKHYNIRFEVSWSCTNQSGRCSDFPFL